LPGAIVFDVDGSVCACNYLEVNRADAVLIDARIPLQERLALIGRLKRDCPAVRVVVLVSTSREREVAQDTQADAVLPSDSFPEELASALRGM
jgi:DNA-binding NarL/FixJ family response regulator